MRIEGAGTVVTTIIVVAVVAMAVRSAVVMTAVTFSRVVDGDQTSLAAYLDKVRE